MLREVKVIAAKRGTSVSAMLREKLEALATDASDYEVARREFMNVASKGFELGAHGQADWTRDDS